MTRLGCQKGQNQTKGYVCGVNIAYAAFPQRAALKSKRGGGGGGLLYVNIFLAQKSVKFPYTG